MLRECGGYFSRLFLQRIYLVAMTMLKQSMT